MLKISLCHACSPQNFTCPFVKFAENMNENAKSFLEQRTARASPARTKPCTKADPFSQRSSAVVCVIARPSASQFQPGVKVDAFSR